MQLERVDAPEEVLDLDPAVVEDSADREEGEVDTTETEVTVTEVMARETMATEALEAMTGALVAAAVAEEDTEVEDTLVEATEKIGDRVDMIALAAAEATAMDTTAMLHTSKHLPDSRSSLGWLYFKDALLKKNVHVLLLTLVL